MSTESRPQSYRFDHAVLEPSQRRLVVDGATRPVTARGFDLLLLLVERAGQLVSKDECFERVWPGLVVEENNLQQQIAALRKVLGPNAIENVPGHGYRFTPVVSEISGLAESATPPRRAFLPHRSTSFVGRDQELREIRELLQSTQLLTLLGPGGIGKTRLCVQLAEIISADFVDGVAFIDLAPLSDPRLVVPTTARTLDIVEKPDRPIADTLVERLAGANMLLILDNCEHLLDECARLAFRLLRVAPKLRMLATSREPLRTSGETTYPVAALEAPDVRHPELLVSVGRYPAARLFVDRATAVQPSFVVTQANASVIAQICSDLDGIPLSLELAATRVRTMSVEAIADRLTDRFRLLKTRDQTTLPRQQALRATMDWSYDLLDVDEQLLLARLAVFAGGFTLEATEYVGAAGNVHEDDIFDLLSNLVEKSLVVLDAQTGRYRLLETIRQYALERLVEAAEEQDARRRHLRYMVRLARAAENELLGSGQTQWQIRLDAERDNIFAAFAFCARVDEGTLAALELIHALRPWMYRSQLQVWYRICEEALMRRSVGDHPIAASEALYAASTVAYYSGHYERAGEWARQALPIAVAAGHTSKIMDVHVLLGLVGIAQGERSEAKSHLNEALALARDAGDRIREADASANLAELFAEQGDLAAAEPLYEQAKEANRLLGHRDNVRIGVINLARIAVGKGAPAIAFARLREAIELGIDDRSAQLAQMLLTVASGLAARLGEFLLAARYFGAAEAHVETHGYRREPTDQAFLAPLMAATRDALRVEAFDQEVLRGSTLGVEAALEEIRGWVNSENL